MAYSKILNSFLYKIISWLIGLFLFFNSQFAIGQNLISNKYIINLGNCPNFANRICVSSHGIIELDSFSVEGIKGFWTPQIIKIDTINGNTFNSKWKAIDISPQCANDTLVKFEFILAQTMEFNIPTALCKKYGIYQLPEISLDSIIGKWNVTRINTDTLPLGTLNLTFIPNSNCIDTFNTKVEIVDFTYPQFNIKTKVCISEAPFDLPLISEDGVTGVWTERTIIPSIIGSSFVSIFTPDIAFRDCYLPVAVTFEVYSKLKPEFSLPDNVCFSNPYIVFVNVSDNNVSGKWSIPNIDNSAFNNPVLRNTFVPDNFQCHEIITIEIPVITFSPLSLQVTEPSDCGLSDGIITISNARVSDEFSLDSGVTWQTLPKFSNLTAGNYSILIRSKDNLNCLDSLKTEIAEPPLPTITMLQVNDLTDCKNSNGSIICSASGNNLEYSLDEISWQSSSTFQNLGSGNYLLYVRSNKKDNCKVFTTFEIKKAQLPIINGINVTGLSSCTSNNGVISIDAIGQNNIYSIDNGVNFQQNSLFSNLPYGNYQIIVSSTSLSNCTVDTIVPVNSPALPNITNIVTTNQTDCGINDGMINIIAQGDSIEYSIDNGETWSDNSLFTNLIPATYQIVIRNKNILDCLVKENVVIDSLDYPTIQTLEITQPTDCISDNAKINIITNVVNPEFSIDMGLTWKPTGNYDNLKDGNYKLLTRVINTTNCIDSTSFDIKDPECPCLKPNVDAQISQVHCKDSLTGTIKIKSVTGFFTNENYEFRWCDGTSNLNYSNLDEGWYCYTIDYDRNCSHKDSLYVGTRPPIEFDLIGKNETCKKSGEIEVINIKGGLGAYQYSLDKTEYQSSPSFKNLIPQKFIISVKDSLGCTSEKDIFIEKEPELTLDIPDVQPIQKGSFVILYPFINPSIIDSFRWTPIEYINNLNEFNANVSPPLDQKYTLTVYYGTCTESKSIIVEVLPSNEVFFPNILLLGSQKENNLFHLFTDTRNETRILNIKIFDRWGNLVFYKLNPEMNNKYDIWDGTLNNQAVETGAYFFFAKLIVNGKPQDLQGTINVIK